MEMIISTKRKRVDSRKEEAMISFLSPPKKLKLEVDQNQVEEHSVVMESCWTSAGPGLSHIAASTSGDSLKSTRKRTLPTLPFPVAEKRATLAERQVASPEFPWIDYVRFGEIVLKRAARYELNDGGFIHDCFYNGQEFPCTALLYKGDMASQGNKESLNIWMRLAGKISGLYQLKYIYYEQDEILMCVYAKEVEGPHLLDGTKSMGDKCHMLLEYIKVLAQLEARGFSPQFLCLEALTGLHADGKTVKLVPVPLLPLTDVNRVEVMRAFTREAFKLLGLPPSTPSCLFDFSLLYEHNMILVAAMLQSCFNYEKMPSYCDCHMFLKNMLNTPQQWLEVAFLLSNYVTEFADLSSFMIQYELNPLGRHLYGPSRSWLNKLPIGFLADFTAGFRSTYVDTPVSMLRMIRNLKSHLWSKINTGFGIYLPPPQFQSQFNLWENISPLFFQMILLLCQTKSPLRPSVCETISLPSIYVFPKPCEMLMKSGQQAFPVSDEDLDFVKSITREKRQKFNTFSQPQGVWTWVIGMFTRIKERIWG